MGDMANESIMDEEAYMSDNCGNCKFSNNCPDEGYLEPGENSCGLWVPKTRGEK